MLRRKHAVALAVLALVVGCRPEPVGNQPTEPHGSSTDSSTAAQATAQANAASRIVLGRPGAGHTANIDLVAATSDGSAALSRDQIGGTRLWPTLDGDVEPIVIPERGPQSLSVERRGKGFTVAVVPASGGGKIFSVDEDGRVALTGELPPFQPLFSVDVLPGGERALVLRKDHAIQLVDADGKELALFNERRFRPNSLRLAADGKTFAAVLKESVGNRADIQRMRIETNGGKTTIAALGKPVSVEGAAALMPSTTALSPDAKLFAWADKANGNVWELKVTDLTRGTDPKMVTVEIPAHLIPNIGFSDEIHLLVSANDGTLSWLLDLEGDRTRPRAPAPQDFVNQGRAQAVAANTQIVGFGTWLYVHDVTTRRHRFLGYRSFQTQSIALSPSGSHVAWSYAQGPVFVEALAEGAASAVRIGMDPNAGAFKIRFIDEDHLLSVTAAGGLELYAWRTGTVVGDTGINGSVRNVQYEPATRLLLVERHNNDSRVFEVSPKGFVGPYIVADQAFRAGLLARGLEGHKDSVMWSLDSSNQLRFFSLKALRSDLSRQDLATMATPLGGNAVAPLAIDRDGRRYGVRWNGSQMDLFVEQGADTKTRAAPAGDVNQITPSPDGKRFLAIHQRGQSVSISAHRTDTLEQLWGYSTGVFNNEVVWSEDGRYVGIAANTGAVVLDAATGESVRRRCGLEFSALSSPPPNAFNGLQLQSLCEEG